MKRQFAAAFVAGILMASAAQAATTYNFVVAPVLGANGNPLADDGGRVDGRTFTFSIGADEVPTVVAPFTYPNYRMKSYSYTEFGSTTPVVVPATLGKNIVFDDYINQGGLYLTNSGNRNFFLYGDTVGGSQAEVLYDDAAYKAAILTDPTAQPVFKLGTFLLSTYPRNNSATQPIQNYTVTISDADAVSAVPEPASWAMMIAGVGFAGGSLRSRRQSVRFA
jgi:hypothetical protein